jgi:hypothetical protein
MDAIFRHTACTAQALPQHQQRIQEIVADWLQQLSGILNKLKLIKIYLKNDLITCH